MKLGNILSNNTFGEKVQLKLIMETPFTREISIHIDKDQIMEEHQSPLPITVNVVKGNLRFTVEQKDYILEEGDLLSLEGAIPHSFLALEKSIIRLTMSLGSKITQRK